MSQEKIERWDAVNGNDAPQDKLTAFFDSGTDAYAILQLRRTDETAMERFESLASLSRMQRIVLSFDSIIISWTALKSV